MCFKGFAQIQIGTLAETVMGSLLPGRALAAFSARQSLFFSPNYLIHCAIIVYDCDLYVDRGEEMVYDCVIKPVQLTHNCERFKSRFMDSISSGIS